MRRSWEAFSRRGRTLAALENSLQHPTHARMEFPILSEKTRCLFCKSLAYVFSRRKFDRIKGGFHMTGSYSVLFRSFVLLESVLVGRWQYQISSRDSHCAGPCSHPVFLAVINFIVGLQWFWWQQNLCFFFWKFIVILCIVIFMIISDE